MGRARVTMVLGICAALSACRATAPREPPQTPSMRPRPVETTGAVVGPSDVLQPVVAMPALLARASTWALELDSGSVYYGDADRDLLLTVPKLGGPSSMVGEKAPWAVALASRRIVWIGSPGDVVLAAPLPAVAGAAEVLRRGGLYTGVAANEDDVYVTEVQGEAGALVRIAKDGRATRLASLRGQPRALALDATHVYVQTLVTLERVPLRGGRLERVAEGVELSRLAIDDDHVYTTARLGPTRALMRSPKRGGKLTVVEYGVRDAPFAVFGPEAFYFDINQPALRRVAKSGGASTIVARSPPLLRVTALAVDASGIFVGTEIAEGGGVLALPLAPPSETEMPLQP